jgi:carbon storage regulator
MLVLTRKKDESIMLGEDIEVVVLEITPTQVRLGVNAPRDCAVYRKEIFTAIQEENIKAARQTVQVELIKTEVKELFAGDDEKK